MNKKTDVMGLLKFKHYTQIVTCIKYTKEYFTEVKPSSGNLGKERSIETPDLYDQSALRNIR